MIGLGIRFELGRFHATPWGVHVNEGAVEWPPSPWRLIRALYSTARTNVGLSDLRPDADRALQALIDAPPPQYVLPLTTAAHTRHYMPLNDYSIVRTTSTAKVIDGFLAIDPSAELEVWWDATLDEPAAQALSSLSRALGYLGRSESVCSARLLNGSEPTSATVAPVDPSNVPEGELDLTTVLCPQSGRPLESFAVSVSDLRKRRRHLPDGTEKVSYAVARSRPSIETAPATAPTELPTCALFRLRGALRPAIADAVIAGQSLRRALQSVYGNQNKQGSSVTFSGRQGDRPRADQHRHTHYLALPDAEGRRIDRFLAWAPEGFDPAEVQALATISYLSIHGIPEPLPLALVALGRIPDLELPEIMGKAHSWSSLTPFGLIRHPKMKGGKLVESPEDQVRRELSHRGLPEPETVILEPGAWHRFRSHKSGQSRLQQVRVFGVQMRFSQPVGGPIALGAFSHYGLGLFTAQE